MAISPPSVAECMLPHECCIGDVALQHPVPAEALDLVSPLQSPRASWPDGNVKVEELDIHIKLPVSPDRLPAPPNTPSTEAPAEDLEADILRLIEGDEEQEKEEEGTREEARKEEERKEEARKEEERKEEERKEEERKEEESKN